MGSPTVRPPAAAALRETAAISPPYPPVTTIQPCPASRPPSRMASTCRGSPGRIRAEPSTATSTCAPRGPGGPGRVSPRDALVATDTFLLGQGHDDPAQDAFAVLAARIERQGFAYSRLAAGFMNMSMQAEHGLDPGERLPDRRASDSGDHRGAAARDRPELLVERHRLVDRRLLRRDMKVEDSPGRIGELCGLAVDEGGQVVFIELARRVPRSAVRVPDRDHLKAARQLHHPLVRVNDRGAAVQDVLDQEGIVIARGDEALD